MGVGEGGRGVREDGSGVGEGGNGRGCEGSERGWEKGGMNSAGARVSGLKSGSSTHSLKP